MAGFPSQAEWLQKAADARQLAQTMNDANARYTMLVIAAGFERMAQYTALLRDQNLPINQVDNC